MLPQRGYTRPVRVTHVAQQYGQQQCEDGSADSIDGIGVIWIDAVKLSHCSMTNI